MKNSFKVPCKSPLFVLAMAAANYEQKPAADVIAKRERIKKNEIIKELNQIKLKLQAVDREKAAHVYNKRGEFYKDFGSLKDVEEKMTTDRSTEKVKLQQQLSRIKGMVKKFQRELKDVKPTPEFVERLKVLMEEIEGHIADFKERQREQYEEMMRDERIIGQEVAALDKRFDSWSQQGSALDVARVGRPGGALPSHRETERDLPPEVKAFERYVAANGGPRGGWDEYDHGTFLKFRNRHNGKLSFLRDLTGSLPTKTDVEIREHEQWYREYLDLNDKKKEAIQRWKERKELEKDEVLSKAEKEEQEAEKEREREKDRLMALEEDREERKLHLNKWKIEKEIERAEKEERELRARLAKAEKEEKDQRKKQAMSEKVLEYKKTKKEIEEQQKLEHQWREQVEQEEKQRRATVLVSKYRERDLTSVKQRKAEQEEKQKAEERRQKRIEEKLRQQVDQRVCRDPSRLLQPTAGWRERQKDTATSGGQLLHMPHRAVPGWRQGLQ